MSSPSQFFRPGKLTVARIPKRDERGFFAGYYAYWHATDGNGNRGVARGRGRALHDLRSRGTPGDRARHQRCLSSLRRDRLCPG